MAAAAGPGRPDVGRPGVAAGPSLAHHAPRAEPVATPVGTPAAAPRVELAGVVAALGMPITAVATDDDHGDEVRSGQPWPAGPAGGDGLPARHEPLASGRGGSADGGAAGALPSGLTRDELIAAVAAALTPVPEGAALLAAVSGGPDSTAMTHLLTLARPDLDVEVVHVRQGLRDDAAAAATARSHARALEVGYHEEAVEVGAGAGPEAAARDVRYAALLRRAHAVGAAWLAVGHTADDQAETVLMNLVRGAGLRGLSGMRPLRTAGRVHIVRPLLRIRRDDVAAFIAGEGLQAVADPTNRDPQQRRARARHEVLPVLERLAGGPGDVVAAFARMAELARIDADALDALASEHAARLVVAWGPARAVRIDGLNLLPRARSARILRRMAADVGGDLTADAVARVERLEPGAGLHIAGGAFVTCGGGWLGFSPGEARPLVRTPLVVPGATRLTQLGVDVHVEWPWPLPADEDPDQLDLGLPSARTIAQVVDDPPPGPLADPPPGSGPRARMWAVFGADIGRALVEGADFAVRARRDGDRLRSSVGMRKLQDLLVDAHVPRVCRDLVPVVVDEHDEPLWVPGVAQRVCDTREPAGMRVWLAPCGDVG